MSQIKSYPTPSKIRYRLERIWLRQWFRKLVLFTLVTLILLFFSLFVLISSYDWTKLETFKQNIFERPELSISKLKINNANSDLVNQINAILQLSFPINSIQLDIKNLQKIINNIDLVETANIRINDKGVLVIDVVERKPVAIFREADQLTLIDIKGFKINNIFSRSDRKDLPLIVGIDGILNVQEALKIYQILSNNIKEIRGLIRIGERRWDIILKSDKRLGEFSYVQPGLGISGGNIERDLENIKSLVTKKDLVLNIFCQMAYLSNYFIKIRFFST